MQVLLKYCLLSMLHYAYTEKVKDISPKKKLKYFRH